MEESGFLRQLEFGADTHTGKVRAHNEDCLRCLPELGLFIVADGLGGEAAGEVASRVAVEVVASAVASGKPLETAVELAHRAVREAAKSGQGRYGMGTTIVCLLFDETDFKLAWVGDSRAYRLREEIEQLSHDHSLVQELLDNGVINATQALTHPRRNVITRALGGQYHNAGVPDTLSGSIQAGDVFMLCSDGLHGLVTEDTLASTIRCAADTEAAVESLLRQALDAGGTDNVSLIVVRT